MKNHEIRKFRKAFKSYTTAAKDEPDFGTISQIQLKPQRNGLFSKARKKTTLSRKTNKIIEII